MAKNVGIIIGSNSQMFGHSSKIIACGGDFFKVE